MLDAGSSSGGAGRVKVALVLDRFDPQAGGLEQWTVRLAAHLIGAGHEVHVVAFEHGAHGLPIVFHRVVWTRSLLERARRIEALLAGLGADVVHDSGTSWSGDVFQPQTGSRLLSMNRDLAAGGLGPRIMSTLSPRMAGRRWRMARLEARQAACAPFVIAVSRRVRDQLARRHGLDPARMVLIPNGVDTQVFTPDHPPGLRAAARARLGMGGSVMFLVTAYNLRLKGIDTAMRALSRLLRQGHDARLVVAGGVSGPFWRRLADALQVSQRVTFCGPVADPAELFAAADAYVQPSRWDACSLATIEGMASGLPVITTAVNGASELIDDGRTGFVLADPEDVEACAGRMIELMDAATRQRIGAAARAASLRCDIRDNLRAVEAVLIDAAAARRRG